MDYKTYKVCYTMVDGEVFKRLTTDKSYGDVYLTVCNELEETCFSLGQQPYVILVSANVRNIDIVQII